MSEDALKVIQLELEPDEKVYKELLTLPLHVDLSQDDISHIASSLKQLL